MSGRASGEGAETEVLGAGMDDGPPPEVWAAWNRACRCCVECSPTVCDGVQLGAGCERRCHCEWWGVVDEGPDDGDE